MSTSPCTGTSSCLRFISLTTLLLAFSLAGCDAKSASATDETASPQVKTVTVRAAPATQTLVLPATSRPGEHAFIFARATGILTKRQVDIGDTVSKEQVLAEVSAPEIDQHVRQANAQLQLAAANVKLSASNLKRAQTLVSSGAIAREVYEQRQASYAVDQASWAAATAQLAGLEEEQRFQIVKAPFAGVVSARNVNDGDRVIGDQAASTLPLFELSSLDPLRIVVDAPQSAVMHIRPGIAATVQFQGLSGPPMKTTVTRMAKNISGSSGGMRIELRLPNPGNRIPSGMAGEVELAIPAQPAVLAPISTVVRDGAVAYTLRLRKNSTVEYCIVTLGRNLGDMVEVISGLGDGDTLVLSPGALLQRDMKVTAIQ